MIKYKTIDLFAGIGGIRRGFEMTGKYENVLSAEIDKYACMTYEHLFGESPYNDVSSEEFKVKVENIEYDILLGGFPCQAFSIAGKKEGFRDKTRGTLFFEVADIIDRTQPKAFLLENVEGLVRHKQGETFAIILETLVNELNYNVIGVEKSDDGKLLYRNFDFILNSKNFGLPQNRPRVYIMGIRQDLCKGVLNNYKLPQERTDLDIYKDIDDLLEKVVEDKYYVPQGYLETLERHKSRHKSAGNGFGYTVVNRDKTERISNAILATGGSGKERNIVYQPKEGVGGKQILGKKTPLNNQGLRFMNPTEWGKLQGFIGYAFMDEGKDKFVFPKNVSVTQQYKQFGNSVAIPVLEELANYLHSILSEVIA